MESCSGQFDVVPAQTAEQLAWAFRLRYQVYCVENAFEEPNPFGLECDGHDAQAVHSLLLDRASRDVLGTVRLVLPVPGEKCMGLPIRDVCEHELIARDTPILPWSSTAEISRFAVSKKMCQCVRNKNITNGDFSSDDHIRRSMPELSLGLMQAVMAMALKNGITHLCAVMEPALLRMVRRLGMDFLSLGAEVNYHGRRQPCYLHIETALHELWLKRRDVWAFLTRDGALWPLSSDLAAQPAPGRAVTQSDLHANAA